MSDERLMRSVRGTCPIRMRVKLHRVLFLVQTELRHSSHTVRFHATHTGNSRRCTSLHHFGLSGPDEETLMRRIEKFEILFRRSLEL